MIEIMRSMPKKLYSMQAPPEEEDCGRASGPAPGVGAEASGSSGQEQDKKEQMPQSSLFSNLAQEVKDTIMPLETIRSYTRKYKGPLAEAGPYSGTSEIAVVQKVQTPWERAWGTIQDKVRNAVSCRLRDMPIH
jgi:hypothetical protein